MSHIKLHTAVTLGKYSPVIGREERHTYSFTL